MYYPYLRGKQNELLALREFAQTLNGTESKIFPIIEPVRKNKSSLIKAASVLSENDIDFGIILNPELGECKSEILNFSEDIPDGSFSPTFIVNDNIDEIQSIIDKNRYRNVYLVIAKGALVEDEKLMPFVNSETVSGVLIDPARKGDVRSLKKTGKIIVELNDCFEYRAPNIQYVDIDEELFSESFSSFEEEGYQGFADYTSLPNVYIEGGALPKVLVMNFTYRKNASQLMVKHFCSDSNREDRSNLPKKYKESANKAIRFFESISYTDIALQYLKETIKQDKYPGLGVIKRISVLHHLLLVQSILS